MSKDKSFTFGDPEDFLSMSNIDRLVIVNEEGRQYDRRDIRIESSIQDGGQTLKLFIESNKLSLDEIDYIISVLDETDVPDSKDIDLENLKTKINLIK